ncbi:MAG TPA: TIGR02453 family protein [Nevskiaceae bacterium]
MTARQSIRASSRRTYFRPATFRFLRGLEKHNDRAWFNARKPDYIAHVRTPMLELIADLAAPLATISPHFVADARVQGGSMFRIYRDVRFTHDKRPYKEWISFRLCHERTRELAGDTPCFYLHVQPRACFVGAGVWRPRRERLVLIRDYLVNNPASWQQATRSAEFTREFRFGGEALKRAPLGFDPTHELIDDLRRRDFVVHGALTEDQLMAPGLVELLITRFRQLAPMVDWLCGALDLDF